MPRTGKKDRSRNAKSNANRRAVQREIKAEIDAAVGPTLAGRLLGEVKMPWADYLSRLADTVALKAYRVEHAAEAVVAKAVGEAVGRNLGDMGLSQVIRVLKNELNDRNTAASKASANAAEWRSTSKSLGKRVLQLQRQLIDAGIVPNGADGGG